MREYYRQGDVILEIVDKIPDGPRRYIPPENGRIVLAHGEATGHSHAVLVPDGEAELVELIDTIERYLVVHREVPFVHEEHAQFDLEPRIYEVRIQREYMPDAIRPVSD